MADRKSISDHIDDEIEARATAEAEAEIDAGHGVPHEKVQQWLLKLAKREIANPPCRAL
jgi:predicted transcriptional regulator